MSHVIITDGNLNVTITRIMQWRTYDGLLEGLPTIEMNNRHLTVAKEEAKKFCWQDEIYLIEPEQTPISYDEGKYGKYPFGKPASLPQVTCIAKIKCLSTTFKDKTKDYSSLGIIWFQENYAFPIDKNVLEKIKEIPFRESCGEFEW